MQCSAIVCCAVLCCLRLSRCSAWNLNDAQGLWRFGTCFARWQCRALFAGGAGYERTNERTGYCGGVVVILRSAR